MFIWLVTVRAAEGRSDGLGQLLNERLLPLLRSWPGCTAPEVARCIHCAGEHTYLAHWPSEAAVLAFESSRAYRAVAGELTPLLRVPPKRELWAITGR